MNWKYYQQRFERDKSLMSEDFFVLGVDMGAATSSIAYFDVLRQGAEVLDISGGYGKPSSPTALQYIVDTKEWIFGEYAIQNANGTDALLRTFVEQLSPAVYLDTGAGSRPVTEIAAVYLRELIANCKSINPKATVAGIAAVVPDFISNEAVETLKAVYGRARYEGLLIELVQERKAALAYCHHKGILPEGGRLLWLDFGARGLRGGLYELKGGYDEIACLASAFDETLGTAKIDNEIYSLLAGFYCQQLGLDINYLTKAQEEELLSFVYGHKDLLFNQAAGRELRLYYNFVHPPFAKLVKPEQVVALAAPWEQGLEAFARGLLAQEDTRDSIEIICTGGGFEMPWARKKIAAIFSKNQIHSYKNPKGVLAQGATVYAASALSLLPAARLEISDSHKLPWDIGINIEHEGKSRFHSLLARGSWLWQKPKPTYLIAQDDKTAIELFVRDDKGGTRPLGTAALKGLPSRPAGTTKMSLEIEAISANSYAVRLKDLGFGKIYPSTGFVEQFVFDIT